MPTTRSRRPGCGSTGPMPKLWTTSVAGSPRWWPGSAWTRCVPGPERKVSPDPSAEPDSATSPEEEALLADSVGLALLVVLDTLQPAERLAFVLHDMFAVPFEEIAPIVGRTPVAARQLASRARRQVRSDPAVPDASAGTQREVVAAFLA